MLHDEHIYRSMSSRIITISLLHGIRPHIIDDLSYSLLEQYSMASQVWISFSIHLHSEGQRMERPGQHCLRYRRAKACVRSLHQPNES